MVRSTMVRSTGNNIERLTLSVEEAAGALGISRSLAFKLVREGKLPAKRLGRRLVVPIKQLEAALQGGING